MINELRGAMEKSIEVNGLNHPHTLKLKEMLDSHMNSEQRDYTKDSITNAEIKRGLLNQSLFRKLISEVLNPSRNQEVFEAAMRANESVENDNKGIELFIVSLELGGVINVALNSELECVLPLNEFETLNDIILNGLSPIAMGMSKIIKKNLGVK